MSVHGIGLNKANDHLAEVSKPHAGSVSSAPDADKAAILQAQDQVHQAQARSNQSAKSIYSANVNVKDQGKFKAGLKSADHLLQKYPRQLAGAISRNPRVATLLALGGAGGLGGAAFLGGEHVQGKKDEAKTGVPMA